MDASCSYSPAHCEKYGLNENGDVHQECAVADVIKVVLDIVVDGKAAKRAELPQSGYARSYAEPLPLLLVVVLHDEWHFRPGADERHIPQQDIQQLRQLIQAGSAKQSSDAGDARVAGCGRGEFISGGAGVHRAELINVEECAVATNSLLDEERWPGRIQADEDCDESEKRGKKDEQKRGEHKIESALAEGIIPGSSSNNGKTFSVKTWGERLGCHI